MTDHVILTLPQLAYLAALTGTGPLVGVPDPFTGLLAVEVQEALSASRQELVERQLIPSPTLMALFAALKQGTACRLATGGRVRYIYGGRVCLELEGDQAVLSVVDHAAIPGWLGIDGQSVPSAGAWRLPSSAFERALELGAEGRGADAAIFLEQAGLPRQQATALAEAMSGANTVSSLVTLTRSRFLWVVGDGAAFLATVGALWRITSAGEMLDIATCVPAEAERTIGELLFRASAQEAVSGSI